MDISTVLSIVFGVAGAVGCFYLIGFLRDACVISSIHMDPEEDNSNEQAFFNTVGLTKEAKEEIEIFDDGDDFEGSVYNNDAFIDAVREKFIHNPDFEVRVFFNVRSPQLKFIQAFKDNPRVAIYVRREEDSRPPDKHYKIIDGGIKGNISKHPLGDGDRTYQNFVCTAKSESDRIRAGRNVLRKFRQPIKHFDRIGGT